MDRLELDVRHSRLHEHRKRRLVVVQEPLEGCHALLDLLVRGRDKEGLTRPGPPDPVLRPSELAGGLIAPSTVREKDAVNLAQEPVGKGKPSAQPLESML